jgi:ABC-2 type transport system ATP-binding protein
VEQTADDVLVLAHGRLVRSGSLAELQSDGGGGTTVRTPDGERLVEALTAAGLPGSWLGPQELLVSAPPAAVGELAAKHGVVLHRLAETAGGLEDIFLSLTQQPPQEPAP